jgi:hypothetical protein
VTGFGKRNSVIHGFTGGAHLADKDHVGRLTQVFFRTSKDSVSFHLLAGVTMQLWCWWMCIRLGCWWR